MHSDISIERWNNPSKYNFFFINYLNNEPIQAGKTSFWELGEDEGENFMVNTMKPLVFPNQ